MPVNRLAGETSPYLLQHAHNPVDWYPWGDEALHAAHDTDRPIFLSIGYAACHWCHVMERESFEDAATAAFMNDHFVAVKVDREERPDLDGIYMAAVQALTGQGGWPMSVFLTPDGRPFFGGTYFPGERMHGMPAFRDVLGAVAEAWRSQRDEVEASARRVATAIGAPGDAAGRATEAARPLATGLSGPGGRDTGRPPLDPALLDRAVEALAAAFDETNGGWGGAPKFPQPLAIEFLLRRAAAHEDGRALSLAVRALDAMAAGGIHDHVGGGFHRYATDATWLVPHFEKMLYDNALLARAYLHAYQLTGDPRHRSVAERTVDGIAQDLGVDGMWAASLDADTDGTEGATYTWTLAEIETLLGADAPLFATAYGVTGTGNWEGRTILSRVTGDDRLAAMYGVSEKTVAGTLARCLDILGAARGRRSQPKRDDKALASWNGLMLATVADAARILGRPGDREAAVMAGTALLGRLRGPDGRLRRSWKDGRATLNGYLEDHAALADGLLALYEATFDEQWFAAARDAMDIVMAHYADPAGGFFDTSDDHETLLLRPKQLEDGATPSGNALATTVLLRLAAFTGHGPYRVAAEAALGTVAAVVARYPTGFAQWLMALDLAAVPIVEVAIVGDPEDGATRALIDVPLGRLRPHQVVAVSAHPAASTIELLQSRFALRGLPTAFVCRDFSCRQPVTEPAALAALLVD